MANGHHTVTKFATEMLIEHFYYHRSFSWPGLAFNLQSNTGSTGYSTGTFFFRSYSVPFRGTLIPVTLYAKTLSKQCILHSKAMPTFIKANCNIAISKLSALDA